MTTTADSLARHTAWVQAILDRTNAEIATLTDRIATLTTDRDNLTAELAALADLTAAVADPAP